MTDTSKRFQLDNGNVVSKKYLDKVNRGRSRKSQLYVKDGKLLKRDESKLTYNLTAVTTTERGTKTQTKTYSTKRDRSGNVVKDQLISVSTTRKGKTFEGTQPTKAQVTGNEPKRQAAIVSTNPQNTDRFIKSLSGGYYDQLKRQSISDKEYQNRSKDSFTVDDRFSVKDKLNKKTSETRFSDLAFDKSTKFYEKAKNNDYFINRMVGDPGGVRRYIDFGKSAFYGASSGILKLTEIDYLEVAKKTGKAYSKFVIDAGATGADLLRVKETQEQKRQRDLVLGDDYIRIKDSIKDSKLFKNPIGTISSFAATSIVFTGAGKLISKIISPLGRSIKGGILKTTNKPVGNINIRVIGGTSGKTTALKLSQNIPFKSKAVISYKERLAGFRGTILRQTVNTKIIATPRGVIIERFFKGKRFLTVQKKGSNFIKYFSGKGKHFKLIKTFKQTAKDSSLIRFDKLLTSDQSKAKLGKNLIQKATRVEAYSVNLKLGKHQLLKKNKFSGFFDQKTVTVTKSKVTRKALSREATSIVNPNGKFIILKPKAKLPSGLNIGKLQIDDLLRTKSKDTVINFDFVGNTIKKGTSTNFVATQMPEVTTSFSTLSTGRGVLQNSANLFSSKSAIVPNSNILFLQPQLQSQFMVSIPKITPASTSIERLSQNFGTLKLSSKTAIIPGYVPAVSNKQATLIDTIQSLSIQSQKKVSQTKNLTRFPVLFQARQTQSMSLDLDKLVKTRSKVRTLQAQATKQKQKQVSQPKAITQNVGKIKVSGIPTLIPGPNIPGIPTPGFNLNFDFLKQKNKKSMKQPNKQSSSNIQLTGMFENIFKSGSLSASLERKRPKSRKKKKKKKKTSFEALFNDFQL
jgi:hypothetical protein